MSMSKRAIHSVTARRVATQEIIAALDRRGFSASPTVVGLLIALSRGGAPTVKRLSSVVHRFGLPVSLLSELMGSR